MQNAELSDPTHSMLANDRLDETDSGIDNKIRLDNHKQAWKFCWKTKHVTGFGRIDRWVVGKFTNHVSH